MKDLLLLLSQYPFEEKNRAALSLLLDEVHDWDKAVSLINAHGITALAAYNIREAGLQEKIPPGAMGFLENGQMKSMVRNLWLTERWKEVCTILTNAGIKHVLLKGMALEHTVYGSKGLRQMNDNDILVKKEDALKAFNLLKQNGFQSKPLKSSLYSSIQLEIGKHLPELSKDGYVIELHHKLFRDLQTGADYPDFVDDAVEIQVAGKKAWILPENIQIMHLKDHFKRHALEGDCQIRLLADIMIFEKQTGITIADDFIMDPFQSEKQKYLRAAYRENFRSIPPKYRLRFLAGDIFPSLKWMKERYETGVPKVLMLYPLRLAKLAWII